MDGGYLLFSLVCLLQSGKLKRSMTGPVHVQRDNMYTKLYRPGYFGRRRDAIIADLNAQYGTDGWAIVWEFGDFLCEFREACIVHYEFSYHMWLKDHPEEVDRICSYGECIDNATTNIQSGLDYTKQEAFSTHIQDIAVRNCLQLLGRKFEGPADKILVIRSADSEGYRYGPGNIPFHSPDAIQIPSKAPRWANPGSVEDFWQSNKYVAVRN
jgi:hypothetical protein